MRFVIVTCSLWLLLATITLFVPVDAFSQAGAQAI